MTEEYYIKLNQYKKDRFSCNENNSFVDEIKYIQDNKFPSKYRIEVTKMDKESIDLLVDMLNKWYHESVKFELFLDYLRHKNYLKVNLDRVLAEFDDRLEYENLMVASLDRIIKDSKKSYEVFCYLENVIDKDTVMEWADFDDRFRVE